MVPDRQICYRALLARDARFDGRFFIAVRTTGIYCRPICPARAPKLENISFYPTAAAAQAAGYRPCLRCRPECSPGVASWRGTSNTVSRALALSESGALNGGDVKGRRDLMHLTIERFGSPLGTILLLSDGDALRALSFDEEDDRIREIMRRHQPLCEIDEGRVPVTITAALSSYFDGDLTAIDSVPVTTGGTPFQRQVWEALRQIPVGTTTSYGALAKRLGYPRASRAVGLANGSNPVGLVVPCHRVIGADGSLTGYGGGLPRKRWLLAHEGVRLSIGSTRAMDLFAADERPVARMRPA